MTIITQYKKLVAQQVINEDIAQYKAVIALDELAKKLLNAHQQKLSRNPIAKIFSKAQPIQGLYFYGPVGRGKTMLMDLFYQQLELPQKRRIHFHHFMESVHQHLHELSGKDNPLALIAKYWAKDLDLLCFDEFFVNDIGDAMLLAGLLNAMLAQGMTLVSTSNCAPEQLYKNGLQRERFLPTIAIIRQYCQVIAIDGEQDHRLLPSDIVSDSQQYRDFRVAKNDNNIESNHFLSQHFTDLCTSDVQYSGHINAHGRAVNYIARSENIIWFDFSALCSCPRSHRDYIYLADNYSAVLVSDVPQFRGDLIPAVFSGVEDSYQRSGVVMGQLRALDDEARRFIALVDEFYDRGVRLIMTAEVDIAQLYQGSQLNFEFARCRSRLFEMQRLSYG